MLYCEKSFLWEGDDYRVFVDPESSQRVIKIPKKARWHPTRFQAQYDDNALKENFPHCMTGEHMLHTTWDGIQDFKWWQKRTQNRQPMTLNALSEHREQFLEILDQNEQMTAHSGTSLDFFWYKCLHRKTWFPEGKTILSDNLAICSERGLVVEDVWLLHLRPNMATWIPDRHIISYRAHHEIEQALLSHLKKKI
jgi:hypothetical protein